MKTLSLTRVALLLALLVISSQFAIPIGPVAISLQTLVVLIIGLVLPTGQAVLTTSLYVFIGFMGLPVFTQAMGGPYSVLLPSFGFILSFIPAVWVMSKIQRVKAIPETKRSFLAVTAGNSIIYVIGILYMTLIFHFYLENTLSLGKALLIGMLPFIPGDIVKSLIAVSVAKRLNRYLERKAS